MSKTTSTARKSAANKAWNTRRKNAAAKKSVRSEAATKAWATRRANKA